MKVGIVCYSHEAETLWNAFRLAVFTQVMGDEVKVFLIGRAVEIQKLDMPKFKVSEQLNAFLGAGGRVLACGTCLEIHGVKPPKEFTVATMKDLHAIVKESDRVVTF